MQAKDIDDRELLAFIEATQHEKGLWVNTWDIQGKWLEIPHKVLWAKFAKLIGRGLLDGCTCGCRGDFEMTKKGRDFLHQEAT